MQLQLDEINGTRRGKKYTDETAAKAIHNGTAMKRDLKESPFVKYFELGMHNDGYWTYNHMATQFEDCVDCLKVLYPHFDFAFTFDHSQGHAKKKANKLDASKMRKGFGGTQARMDPTVINEEEGYLGLFDHDKKLKKVDTQHYIFRVPTLLQDSPATRVHSF